MSIPGIFSSLMQAAGVGTKKHLSSFSFLETVDREHVLVAKDGSMATILRIDGVKKVIGDDELKEIIDKMTIQMSPYLAEEGRAMQVWFARNPDLAPEMIREMMSGPRGVAKKLALDLDDLFDEKQRTLPNWVVWEGFYIVLWTRMSILTKKEREAAKRQTKTPKTIPTLADAQNPFTIGTALLARHQAFVQGVETDLKSIDIRFKRLDTHDAVKAIKMSVYPDLMGSNWRPHLPGDALKPRAPEIGDYDMSHLMWPRIDEQIFDREAEVVSPRIVKLGSQYFASMDMTVGPQETSSFAFLLQRMMDLGECPWRVSYLIEGGGLKSMNIKRILASIFQVTNGENRMIHEAIKGLQEARTSNGTTVARMRMSFATWSPAGFDGDLKLIEERASKLQNAVEGWGYCNVTSLVGDPVAGTFSSALGLDCASTAPAGAVPISDVVAMLPWNRDASPWDHGAVMFRTADGRLWPYDPGSSLQTTFNDLVSAPPGCGKSVWLSTVNLGLALSALATSGTGGIQLPRISIIDIGPSSEGLISLLQEALPPGRRQEVAYHRMKMSADFAINPFDTQLGARYPDPNQRAFLVNFLTLLTTDPGHEPPSGLANMMGAVVDTAYMMLDDNSGKGSPNIYNPGVNIAVDRALKKYNIEVKPGNTQWWEVVDELFNHEDRHHAIVAQRYAVPKLDNLMKILRDPNVMSVHATANTETGETLANAASRLIASAIREYPIFQQPTAFDIGDTKIVALDLMDVAPSGGDTANKQTALMYMLARFVLAKDYYIGRDVLKFIPQEYHAWHEPRIRRLREMPKRIVYDEFHRTSKASSVRDQVMTDMREGRKFGVHICLASQRLEDFDESMVDMATGVWIMGVSERASHQAQKTFGLSPTAHHIIRNNLGAPGKAGAPVMAVLTLKEGRHEHLLYNTLGPVELWAFSTTAEDVALRTRLYDIMGPKETRLELGKRYPGGSAKEEIERRVRVALERGTYKETAKAEQGIIEQLVKEIAGPRYREN